MSKLRTARSKTKKRQTSKNPSLAKEIFSDLFLNHWLVTGLVFGLVLSAMLQARTSHDVRRAVAKRQELRDEGQRQQIKWQALRLEMSSLSEADRISRLARKQLNMVEVTTKNEKIISL